MGVEEVLTTPQSPWQSPYSERLNDNARREFLDHVIVFSEKRLRRILAVNVAYYGGAKRICRSR